MWNKVTSILEKVWKWIDRTLFGSMLELRIANKIVQKKIEQCQINQFESDNRLKHKKQNLESMLVQAIQRLERIENKAMGTLLGVAVAITVFGAALGLYGKDGLLTETHYSFHLIGATLLLLAFIYLFRSGLLALEAYKIGKVYRPTLNDRSPVIEKAQEKSFILYCIEQNQRAATIRSNHLSAAFTCLKNGLMLVLILGFLIVIAGLISVV